MGTEGKVYKTYVLFALRGLRVMYFVEPTYKDFCAQIGKLYLRSMEHINRLDYEIVDAVPDGAPIFHYLITEGGVIP